MQHVSAAKFMHKFSIKALTFKNLVLNDDHFWKSLEYALLILLSTYFSSISLIQGLSK